MFYGKNKSGGILKTDSVHAIEGIEEYKEIQEQEYNAKSIRSEETIQEKEIDRKEAQDELGSGRFIVNMTTENNKPKAVIHDTKNASQDIEFDTERGDKSFETLKEAKEFVKTVL